MDRSVRHDDRGLIVLEQRGQRADRRLVAGNDGDGAGKPGGAQMLAQRIVGDFTPDQRVAHFARAVADAVRRRDGVFRLDQAQLQLARALADAALEAGVDRIDLRHDAHVALAVALGADHADRRLVDQVRIGAKLARNPDGLGRAAGMVVDEDEFRLGHGSSFRAGGLAISCLNWTGDVCHKVPGNASSGKADQHSHYRGASAPFGVEDATEILPAATQEAASPPNSSRYSASSGHGTMVDFTVFIAIASATARPMPSSVNG